MNNSNTQVPQNQATQLFVLIFGQCAGGLLAARVREEADVREKGHVEGYKKGYAEAERLYKVTYPCSVCRQMLTVTSQDEKEATKRYMQEHGWGHKACHERGQ